MENMSYWTSPAFYTKDETKEDREKKETGLILKVCNVYGLTIDGLYSSKRKRETVEARFVLFYIFNKYLHYTLKETGAIFKKDHTTVLYGCKTISDLIDVDNELAIRVNKLINYTRYSFSINSETELNGKTSQYKGVSFHRSTKKWRAVIKLEKGTYKHLGVFKSELEAFVSVNLATKELNNRLKLKK